MNERVTTAGVYVSSKGILIAQRKGGGPLSLKWEFPGGKNRTGESVADTLEREWMEELGVEIEVGAFITKVEFVNNDINYHLKCHYVIPKTEDFVLTEHVDLRFVPLPELLDYDFGPSDFEIAKYIFDNFSYKKA